MKVKIKAVVEFIIDLPINDFIEISIENMTITKSDELITDTFNEIFCNHSININRILAVNEPNIKYTKGL